MTTKDELTEALRKLSEDLFAAWPNPATVEGPGKQFALYLALRARSTYDSIVLLLDDGRHDESVVLYRRLLEDSLRAAYIRRNPERADGLCIRQEMDALNDSIRNLEKVKSKHPQIGAMLVERRRDRSEIDRMIQETGIRPLRFPGPAQIAQQTGRAGDPLSTGRRRTSHTPHSHQCSVDITPGMAKGPSWASSRRTFTTGLSSGVPRRKSSYSWSLTCRYF